MTATSDCIDAHPKTLQPVRLVDGGRMIVRAVQRFFGAALTLAAVGIWIAPGASWESDIMLFKLILSLTAVLAGFGLIQSSVSRNAPKVEIDTIRREVRLVRLARDGSAAVLQRCSFAKLTRVDIKKNNVRMSGEDGKLLAEVTLPDRKTLSRLMAGLRDEGKLA